ncbi:hypothetical protein D9M72_559670 [compost metagenome]
MAQDAGDATPANGERLARNGPLPCHLHAHRSQSSRHRRTGGSTRVPQVVQKDRDWRTKRRCGREITLGVLRIAGAVNDAARENV